MRWKWLVLAAAWLLPVGELLAARGVRPRDGGDGGSSRGDNSALVSPAPASSPSPAAAPSPSPGPGKGVRRGSAAPPAPPISSSQARRNVRRWRTGDPAPRSYSWRGRRYAHAYRHGLHWYGFHHGPDYYWTTYHNDYWWWREPVHHRWVFWYGGRWWWPGPTNVVYVYQDGNYMPAEAVGDAPPGVPGPPEVEGEPPPPASVPALAPAGGTWKSPDGKRMVQVAGERQEAFLYDISGAQPIFLKVLDREVERVRFSGGSDGEPLQILLDRRDGSFRLFGLDGEPGR